MRQSVLTEYDPGPGISVSTLAWEYPSGTKLPEHAHGSHQLIYATCGLMEVSVGQNLWLIPPQFAIWIPARTRHALRMSGPVSMRTLYLKPGYPWRARSGCEVLQITALFRELILEAVRTGNLRARVVVERAVRDLIAAELRRAPIMPMLLSMPADDRAHAVSRLMLDDLERNPPLKELCRRAGTSVRTVQRAFHRDLGIGFEAWRRQARLLKAIELLAAGQPVKQVAFQVGYEQPGTFTQVFRRAFGTAPKSWVRSLKMQPE